MKSSALLFLFVPILILAGSSAALQAHAAKQDSRAHSEHQTLKNRLSENKAQLEQAKRNIAEKKSRLESNETALRQSEKAISESNRTLSELSDKKEHLEVRLQELSREARQVSINVEEAEQLIGTIGEAQFLNSRKLPWQTALTGGNPNDLARTAAILRYMAKEQNQTIERLENRQKNIAAVAEKTSATKAEFAKVEAAEKRNRRQLEQDRQVKEAARVRLNKELQTAQERYRILEENERNLTHLITTLDRQIELAAKREAERLARERAKSREMAARGRIATKPGRPDNAIADKSAPVLGQFGALKGKLRWPTKGTLAARFGQRRSGAVSNLTWRGLLIRARRGEKVCAVAPGTVVFSDWMRGFGNLLIIDHGTNYLSVYANNETLFKSVGEHVGTGEKVAAIGDSGGEDLPGLYFELRHKGKPFDPLGWLVR